MIVDVRHTKQKSDLFYYLSSTTDRKESSNQYKDKVYLNTSNCCYENFKNYLSNQSKFYPHHFDLKDERKNVAIETIYIFFKDIVEMSNSNLIRNADHLLVMLSKNNDEIAWNGENKKHFDD